MSLISKIGVIAAVVLATSVSHAITLQTNTLTIAPNGILDVKTNFIIWRAPDAATNALNLSYATNRLKRGINLDGLTGPALSSFWQGYGINSSSASVDPSLFAVGVLDNGVLGPGSPLYGVGGILGGSFGGVSNLTGNEVLIRYTYTGDADLNGFVDAIDQAQFDGGFNSNLQGWFNGDFNYNLDSNSQNVGSEDGAQFDTGFNSQGAPLVSQGAGASLGVVPEPTSVSLLAFGAMGLLARRRRSGSVAL